MKKLVLNPYNGVDWNIFSHNKANMHTHTTASDGGLGVAEVIDLYKQAGYTILSITDHDYPQHTPLTPTWPWTDYGRDPTELGMVAIKGNELSNHHHINSYFSDVYGTPENSEHSQFTDIANNNGLATMQHPYWHHVNSKTRGYTFPWYKQYYQKYPCLIGLEVLNPLSQKAFDFALWDYLLMRFMPLRPIWGLGNDDFHNMAQFSKNRNVFLLNSLSEDTVRGAMIQGCFYFCTGNAPIINKIQIDQENITIDVEGNIDWISNGKVIGVGNTLRYFNNIYVGRYVRAVIKNDGETYTQPFGFIDSGSIIPVTQPSNY